MRKANIEAAVTMRVSADTREIIKELCESLVWKYEQYSEYVAYRLNCIIDPDFDLDIDKYVVIAYVFEEHIYGQTGLEYGVTEDTYLDSREKTKLPNIYYTKEWCKEVLMVMDVISSALASYGLEFETYGHEYDAIDKVIKAIYKKQFSVVINGLFIELKDLVEYEF